MLGQYSFNYYKSKKTNTVVKKIQVIGESILKALNKGAVIGSAVNYSRDLGNHPANILTPTYLCLLYTSPSPRD